MKINSPMYLSIVVLTALGLGVPITSAAEKDASEVKAAPRVIKVNPADIKRADGSCSHGGSGRSSRCNHGVNCASGHGTNCSACGACGNPNCSNCGSCDCCGPRGIAGLHSAMHSGQPLIDPYARGDWRAAQEAAMRSWHAGYYHTAWGQPVALMVPPQVRMQTRWGWGVSQSTMSPIYHQYERPYPGPAYGAGETGGGGLLPTPRWPSHTDQFGVYYVRGPW